jgi:hypothetical protein
MCQLNRPVRPNWTARYLKRALSATQAEFRPFSFSAAAFTPGTFICLGTPVQPVQSFQGSTTPLPRPFLDKYRDPKIQKITCAVDAKSAKFIRGAARHLYLTTSTGNEWNTNLLRTTCTGITNLCLFNAILDPDIVPVLRVAALCLQRLTL